MQQLVHSGEAVQYLFNIINRAERTAFQRRAIPRAMNLHAFSLKPHLIRSGAFPIWRWRWRELAFGPAKAAQIDAIGFVVSPDANRQQTYSNHGIIDGVVGLG